jgi:hypothetical protein
VKNAIIGVIIAVVAGVVVLAVEYNYFNPKPSPAAPSAITAAVPPPTTDREKAQKGGVANPPVVDSSLVELHKTAKSLSSSYNRDLELNRLVDYAVNKGEIQYAVEIAKDLSSSYGRDLALGKLVEKGIALRRFDIATRAAQSMSSSYSRDLHLSRVLKARQEHEERPNPGVQPTPKSGRG